MAAEQIKSGPLAGSGGASQPDAKRWRVRRRLSSVLDALAAQDHRQAAEGQERAERDDRAGFGNRVDQVEGRAVRRRTDAGDRRRRP